MIPIGKIKEVKDEIEMYWKVNNKLSALMELWERHYKDFKEAAHWAQLTSELVQVHIFQCQNIPSTQNVWAARRTSQT